MIITDQKRVARGEHLKLARYYLQARDGIHHGKWNVMILAGPEPEGEIRSIRELMHHSHILVVDKDMESVTKAATLADAILCCDISPIVKPGQPVLPNPILKEKGPFDLIDLDLCGNPYLCLASLVRANATLLRGRGILMVTFSYGRDVLPMALEEYKRFCSRGIKAQPYYGVQCERLLELEDLSDNIKARIVMVFGRTLLRRLRSIILYQGVGMPMCAVLLGGSPATASDISCIKLCDEDFLNVILEDQDDPCLVYDCPAERLLFLRRSAAARKAIETRQRVALAQASLL